jgi:hypothetical protein
MRATWGIRFVTLLIALAAIGGPAALILKLRDPARFQQFADQGKAWAEQGMAWAERTADQLWAMLPQS